MKSVKLLLLLFLFCGMFFAVGITAQADETTTEIITEQETVTEPETETEPPTEPDELPTLEDLNTTLKFVLYSVSFVGGCLIAQGFSFWKW